MMESKKYKFITIKQVNGEIFQNHPVYRIFSRVGEQIGVLSYYKPWNKYVFSSKPECVFDESCLRDVLDFIDNIKK